MGLTALEIWDKVAKAFPGIPANQTMVVTRVTLRYHSQGDETRAL